MLETLPLSWRTHPNFIMSFSGPLPCDFSGQLHLQLMPHAHVGGVTDGSWSVGSTHPWPVVVPEFPRRSIKHVIDSKVTASHRPSGLALPDTSLLPLQDPLAPFHLPSIFSSAGVERSLTLPELGTAFDVPPGALQQLRPSHLSRLVHACPGKILLFWGDPLLYSSGGVVRPKSVDTLDDTCPLKKLGIEGIPLATSLKDAPPQGVVEGASMVPPPDAPTVDPALEDPTAR